VCKLSISIVCHDNPGLLDACLASIRADTSAPPLQLMVTDNTNSPEVQRVAQHYLSADDILIVNKFPRGFAANNNAALSQSSAAFFLLLNDDTIVLPETLTTMVTTIEHDLGMGALGCKMYSSDARNRIHVTCIKEFPSASATLRDGLIGYTGIRRLFPRSRLVRAWSSVVNSHDVAQEAAHLNGACLLLRAEALHQVGGLDERFFMFLEETDLCLRLKGVGWKLHYTPDAAIIHYGGASGSTAFRRQQHARNMRLFLAKHYGWSEVSRYRLVLMLLWPLHLYHRFLTSAIDLQRKKRRVKLRYSGDKSF